MSPSTKMDHLLRLVRRGPVRARDLDEAGIPRAYLTRLLEKGQLEQIDRGLYRAPGAEASEVSSLADVAKRVPRGVICLLSALQLHQLTTEVPGAVWLMIGRHDRAPRIASPRIEIVRASGDAFEHGVESKLIDGVHVRVTTSAKTVADCFRFRRHVGLEVAITALKDYLRQKKSIDALMSAAQATRVSKVIRPYLEALA